MSCELIALGDLVNIMAGVPISRARKLSDKDAPKQVRSLTPAAMTANGINDQLLSTETVSSVKEDLYTHEGDIIVKTSTPYDCAFIDRDHSGILVTSFALILRARPDLLVDIRYLAAFFELEQTKRQLQEISKGLKLQFIKKRDLAELMVPVPSQKEQARLAALYEGTHHRIELCQAIAAKSELLLESTLLDIITK